MDAGKVVHRRKPEIPVIRSKQDENQRIQEVGTRSLELSKVIGLLEDPLTADMKERHLFVLKKLLKKSKIGFLLRELKDIAKILDLCAEKVSEHEEYLPILCEALTICRLPFLKEKSSDELNYAADVIEFFSHIGCLMRVADPEVRQLTLECVKWLLVCVTPKQLIDGNRVKPATFPPDYRFSRLSLRLQPTSIGYRLQLLERSDLSRTLLLSMAALENHLDIKLQLLQTLQILSGSSDMNCELMLSARGAETICLHMNDPDPSGQILFRSSEILWNLLDRGCKQEVTSQLSSMECVLSLKEAFLYQLTNGFRQSDFELRNDLLVITSLIAENPNSMLIESAFAKQLVALFTFPEMKSQSPLVRNLKFTFSNEDLKMKKLLLVLLVLMSHDLAALQLYKEENVMLALLELVKPPAAQSSSSAAVRSGSRGWSSVQHEALQLQALASMATVAPLMLDEYMRCQGNACLLILLDWCVKQDSFFGHGNSFHGTGGRGSKKAHMRHCIRVLRAVTSLGEESVNQDLCDQGTINQLLGILMQMEASEEEEDLVTVEIKSDVQMILSELCESDMHRKELFGSDGVEMAVHFLKKGSEKFYSGLGHNKLVFSTVDCVWSCIVGCYTTEDYFLAKEGACLLLDLLSSGPRCVHCNVLSTVLELCDNPNALSHVLSWTNKDGRHTFPTLLLQLWRDEEEDMRVPRDQNGVISDPQQPLLGPFQQEETRRSFPDKEQSAAVMELSENLRSKIYSIFGKLGFEELPGLSTKDYVTLSIVRRFLDFKVGDVWGELNRALMLEGVRPITPDREALDSLIQLSAKTAMTVRQEQHALLAQLHTHDLTQEQSMYTEIKSHWKEKEILAESWDRYVSKTSNYDVLKEIKAQRERDIEASRLKQKAGDTGVHQHFMGQLLSVERTGGRGLSGVKLTLSRSHIKPEGRTENGNPKNDTVYLNSVC